MARRGMLELILHLRPFEAPSLFRIMTLHSKPGSVHCNTLLIMGKKSKAPTLRTTALIDLHRAEYTEDCEEIFYS